MSPKPVRPAPRLPPPGALQNALQRAEWRYNEEADEMNVLLPGWEGRPGRAVLIDDAFYVRLDVETGAPLGLLIPAYTSWQADQLGRSGAQDTERRALVAAVAHALRQSPELATAAP